MTITIGSNISSLTAQRYLDRASQAQSRTYEKLSSGLRINRASDDAAGLSIASTLDANIRVYTQGIRNLNDGISFLQIADSTLGSLTSISTRIAELSEQAANGVYGSQQRQALNNEAQALSAEYTRILNTTKFNGVQVFQTPGSYTQLQGGEGTVEITTLTFGSSLFQNIGDGSFESFSTVNSNTPLGGINNTLVSGDFNGDGISDLLGSHHNGGGYFFPILSLGNGDGTFKASISVPAAQVVNSGVLHSVDLDNDGDLDFLIGGGHPAAPGYAVGLNNGSGSFAVGFHEVGGGAWDILSGFFDNDSFIDIVSNNGGDYYISLGNGNGTFKAGTTLNSGQSTTSVTGDFNGDSETDFLFFMNTSVKYHQGNGNGTFNASITVASGLSFDAGGNVTAQDVNNDGFLDFVASSGAKTYVSLGNGNGTFKAHTSYDVGSGTRIAGIVDINNDGNKDIVASAGTSSYVLFGNGNGTFKAGISSTNASSAPAAFALADFNRDGVSDLAAYGAAGLGIQLSSTDYSFRPLSVNLLTSSGARSALDSSKNLIESLSRERGQIGALLSRIQISIGKLSTSALNFRAARSRIIDADVAEQSSHLIRNQIVQQASLAVLVQANQGPALALQLLT